MTTISSPLIDSFGRAITYLRLSVTDRCDFRCVYCMSEKMTFLPRQQILTLEELETICSAFVELGVKNIRLTGGEPLIRPNILKLCQTLGALSGLEELTLTTNGSQLAAMASALGKAGVKRVNISIDSLKPERFARITRVGELSKVIAGIETARNHFQRVKLNSVIMQGKNSDEILDLVNFAQRQDLDITFIEEMPVGQIDSHRRGDSYCSSDQVRAIIDSHYPLTSSAEKTGGPARYYRLAGSNSRIGFISPNSHNFCGDCNRVRLTAEGKLLLCLGNEHSVDLRAVVRRHPGDKARLKQVLIDAISVKPERHTFNIYDDTPQIVRFMNMTGG